MYIFECIDKSDLITTPFPHIIKNNILPEHYYKELERCFPDIDICDISLNDSNKRIDIVTTKNKNDGMNELLHKFLVKQMHHDNIFLLINIFYDYILKYYPNIETKIGKNIKDWNVAPSFENIKYNTINKPQLRISFSAGFNTPVLSKSSVRGIHVDNASKLFSGLLYFRHSQDNSMGGDFEIHKFKDGYFNKLFKRKYISGQPNPSLVELEKSLEYSSNALVVFLNTHESAHAVSERSITKYSRRFINFHVEVDFKLFDKNVYQPLWYNYYTMFKEKYSNIINK